MIDATCMFQNIFPKKKSVITSISFFNKDFTKKSFYVYVNYYNCQSNLNLNRNV